MLYAIGISFLFMVPLRRLPNGVALALHFFWLPRAKRWSGSCVGSDPTRFPLPLALLVVGGERPPLIIGYPPIHWPAIMLLGWVWGRR